MIKKFTLSTLLLVVGFLTAKAQNANEKLLASANESYYRGDVSSAFSLFSRLDSIATIDNYLDLWNYYASAELIHDSIRSRDLLFRIARSNGVERNSFQQRFFEKIGLMDRPYWPIVDSLVSVSESKRCRPFIDSLEIMASADQAIRKEDLSQEEVWQRMAVIDSVNQVKLVSLIEQYGFPTWDLVGRNASENAWLIAQHSYFIIPWYLKEYKKAVEENNADKRRCAYMEDRFLGSNGRPQLYGTQQIGIDSIFVFCPIADFKNVNYRRLTMGMNTIEEFTKNVCGSDSIIISPMAFDYMNQYYPNNSDMYVAIAGHYQGINQNLPEFRYGGGTTYPFPRDLEVLANWLIEGDTAFAFEQAKLMVLCGKRLDEEWHLPEVLMDSVRANYAELRADYERMITKDDDMVLNSIASFDTLVKVLDNGFYPRYTIDAWNGHIKDLIAEKALTLDKTDYELFFKWLFKQVEVGNYHLFDYAELCDEVYFRLFGQSYYGQKSFEESVPISDPDSVNQRRLAVMLPPLEAWQTMRR